jgi:beta-lactamase class A
MTKDELLRKIVEVGLERRGSIGVAACRLDSGEEVRLHCEGEFPTGNVIKLPILVALYRKAVEGKLSLEEPVTPSPDHYMTGTGVLNDLSRDIALSLRDMARLMIVVSDNVATNLIIDLVGRAYVNEAMQDYGLKDTSLRQRLDYASKAWPDYRRVATSSPSDLVLLLSRLNRREILTRETCEEVIDILRRNQYQEMLPRLLPVERQRVLWVADVPGSIWDVRGDAGLVATPGMTYAVAIMLSGIKGERRSGRIFADTDGAQIVARISRLIYDYFVP